MLSAVALLAFAAYNLRAADLSLSLVVDASVEPPARHGLGQLESALRTKGWIVRSATSIEDARGEWIVVAGTSASNSAAARMLRETAVPLPAAPEALVIHKTRADGRPALLLCGADPRGLLYAALDTAERVGWGTNPSAPFSEVRDVQERPFVRERSLSVYTMNRAYWESRFYDERYWMRYFDLLAANRFNKFLIVFGYENAGFLAPCYPYFFDTPGFPGVQMTNLTPEQQRRNVLALNRLIELAHARGIGVAVGIWDHIYRGGVQAGGIEWANEYRGRPIPGTVQGVTTENLNAYTLAALKEFLTKFPGLDEIQFRIHEESGLRRGEMEAFWREVFTMAQRVRPGLLFEARGKGTPDSVIDTALSLGVNLRVETKYWMEQMGLPFHPTHVNPENQRDRRHGYADFLRYPKRYDMNWRLWNGGTARVLLWADPEYVRRYSASTSLYSSPNWDVNEPLATKMEAQRPDAKPFDLMPAKYRYYEYEFERYWHFFQVWGRLGYNPDTSLEIWRREFARRFGAPAAPHIEAALHRASQILPMIVAAVYPYSAFPTTRGWAERQSLGTTLANYANNTGSDIQQFESFKEAAARILADGTTARRTPETTSRWFDRTAADVVREIAQAEKLKGSDRGAEFDSTIIDLRALACLARFHARRAPAAVLYQLFKHTNGTNELDAAIAGEQAAIDAWRDLVNTVGDRYNFDLAMGARQFALSGHWRDELASLEKSFAQLQEERRRLDPMQPVRAVVPKPRNGADREPPVVSGDRVQVAPPQQPLRITARVNDPAGLASVRLRYRHVTQFEDYQTIEMQPSSEPGGYTATVPGDFVTPQWDVMYFIEAEDKAGNGTIWPDLEKEMPYVIVKLQRDEPEPLRKD
jgi:hypothetical protein